MSALGHASPSMELIQVAPSSELKGPEQEGDILELGDGVGLLTVYHPRSFMVASYLHNFTFHKFDLTFSDVLWLSKVLKSHK
jgi:hypothetical protein